MAEAAAVVHVLGQPEDIDVLWLVVALRARGHEVEVVLPQELMIGADMSCRIDSASVTSQLRLADGRVLDPATPGLVVNRLVDLPSVSGGLAPADARFVDEEWRAAVAAWLRTLTCPVLNPPRAASLAGPVLPEAAWRAIAHAFDLPCRPWRSEVAPPATDPVRLTCVGDRCLDPHGIADERMRGSVLAMAAYVGAPLLGLTFERGASGPELVDVNVLPELRPVGDALLDALEQLATQGGDAA